jgi:hypothetical protein
MHQVEHKREVVPSVVVVAPHKVCLSLRHTVMTAAAAAAVLQLQISCGFHSRCTTQGLHPPATHGHDSSSGSSSSVVAAAELWFPAT